MADHTTAGIDLDKLEALARPDLRYHDEYRRGYAAAISDVKELARRSTSGSDALEYRTCCEHPDCTTCAGRGGFYRCEASGSDGTAAAGVGRLPAFTPSEQQYADWCERHDLPYHLSRDAFDDATSLYLTATSGSELADDMITMPRAQYQADRNECFRLGEIEGRESALAQQAGAPAEAVGEIRYERVNSDWYAVFYGEERLQEGAKLYLAAPAPAAQDERDAKDAARYRWLRDHPWSFELPTLARVIQLQQNALWDEQIDAAMSQSKTQGTAGQDGAA